MKRFKREGGIAVMKPIDFITNHFGSKIPESWDKEYEPLLNFSISQLEGMLKEYLESQVSELQKQVEELRDWLDIAEHSYKCGSKRPDLPDVCTCGLDSLLESIK